MKRKLIKFQELEDRKMNSLSGSIKEIVEAQEFIADLLGEDAITLVTFDEGECLFETTDGSYLRADFSTSDDNIILEGVERLVLDESSEQEKAEGLLMELIEALEDDDLATANAKMEEYIAIDVARKRRNRSGQIDEARVRLYGTRGKGSMPKIFAKSGSKDPKKVAAAKLAWRKKRSQMMAGVGKRKRHLSQERGRRKKFAGLYGLLKAKSGGKQYTGTRKRRKMHEWLQLTENVFGRTAFVEGRSVLNESNVSREVDERMTVVLPNAKRRNEGKVLMHQYDMMKTDVKILRESSRRLAQDEQFCKLVAEVRRANALSDDENFQLKLQELASKFPGVLYLTSKELSGTVAESLQSVGITSFDDDMCAFISEGILQTAHDMYSDRVDRILRIANVKISEGQDKFEQYLSAAGKVFSMLDEDYLAERQMFSDLYDAAIEVRQLAIEAQNDSVRTDAANFLAELEEVLAGRQPASQELAEEVAEWLAAIAETNLETEDWDVVKTPHRSENGDNPQMFKNAKVPYTPASDFSGNWGDPAPVSDGKSYKGGLADEMRHKGWGNKAGKDTWPDLKNPYQPDSGHFTMPNDKGVDRDDDNFGTWQDGDTWPNLENPYVPKAGMFRQKVQPNNSVE